MPVEPAPGRSAFVTALAWVFIVLAGFATVIALLQNVMLAVMFPLDEMRAAMREAEGRQEIPPIARYVFGHFQLIFAAFLAFCVLVLASAIGLLLRSNWARVLFIGIMAFGILWNVAGVVLSYFLFSSMPPIPPEAPADFRSGFDIMWKVMMAFSVVMALAFSTLFGWIIRRLASAEIRREFLER